MGHSPVYLVKFYLAIVKCKTGAWEPGMSFLFLARLADEDPGLMSLWEDDNESAWFALYSLR